MNRFASVLLALAALSLFSPAATAQEKRDQQERPRGGQDQQALFERLDANKDGQVTADEVSEERKNFFDRLVRTRDKNDDGKLSKEEFTARGSEERPRREEGNRDGDRPRFEPAAIFRNLDKDGDGKVVPDEVPEERREQFKNNLGRADKDGDGGLNLNEFQAAMAAFAPRAGGREGDGGRPNLANAPFFRAIDADRDGKLSGEELAAAGDALKKLDRNNDGFVTPEELAPPGPGGPGRPQQGGGAEAFRERLKQADTNGDGKLSKEEAPERFKQNFDRIDANSDGFIDSEELNRMFQRFRQAAGDGEGRPRRRGEGDRKE